MFLSPGSFGALTGVISIWRSPDTISSCAGIGFAREVIARRKSVEMVDSFCIFEMSMR